MKGQIFKGKFGKYFAANLALIHSPEDLRLLLRFFVRCNLLRVFWEVECFNQKWLHHHQLESYSKEEEDS
jgi:hypothetical protein